MPVVGFVGRLVMEKGLDVFSDTIDRLARRGVRHKVLVVGDGPARDWFEKRLPDAVFAGFQAGAGSRPRGRLDGHAVQPVGHRDVRQRHAGGDGRRPAGGRGERDRQREPGHRRRHRPAGPARRLRPLLRRRSRIIAPTPRRARAAGAAGFEASQRYGWDEVNGELADAYLRVIRQHNDGGRQRRSPVP